MRDDYIELIGQVVERIYEQEQIILSGTYLETFFRVNGEDKPEVTEKQDHTLKLLIERRHNDSSFMEFVFEVIAQFSPERRRRFIASFLELNKSFEDFQGLSLQPNSYSWSGSAVPVLQGRAEYLESLLPILNVVDLLQHKQYVEHEIELIRVQIEREKKKDFIGE